MRQVPKPNRHARRLADKGKPPSKRPQSSSLTERLPDWLPWNSLKPRPLKERAFTSQYLQELCDQIMAVPVKVKNPYLTSIHDEIIVVNRPGHTDIKGSLEWALQNMPSLGPLSLKDEPIKFHIFKPRASPLKVSLLWPDPKPAPAPAPAPDWGVEGPFDE